MLVSMCMKCDGYSDDQIARNLELMILTDGWAVRGVEPSDEPNDDPDATLAGGGTLDGLADDDILWVTAQGRHSDSSPRCQGSDEKQ